jgi:uncharacterized membrane protein
MVIAGIRIEKNRLEAFSDGVIAIVMTLLILEIKIPHVSMANGEAELIAAIWEQLPKFLSYFLSFVILAMWWIVHHQLFHSIQKIDVKVLWLNNLFLMWLCLIPFPTALIGEYHSTRTAAFLYGAVTTLAAATFFCMRWYVSVKAKLIDPCVPHEAISRAIRRSLIAPISSGIAMIIAVFTPSIALGIYAVVAIYFACPTTLGRTNKTQ